MKPILNSIKIGLRDLLAPYPSFFIPIYRALAPEANVSLLISPKTEIVIEGFPRSVIISHLLIR